MRQEKLFVIRLWNDSATQVTWRASLEDLLSKERLNFASPQILLEFLQNYLETPAEKIET